MDLSFNTRDSSSTGSMQLDWTHRVWMMIPNERILVDQTKTVEFISLTVSHRSKGGIRLQREEVSWIDLVECDSLLETRDLSSTRWIQLNSSGRTSLIVRNQRFVLNQMNSVEWFLRNSPLHWRREGCSEFDENNRTDLIESDSSFGTGEGNGIHLVESDLSCKKRGSCWTKSMQLSQCLGVWEIVWKARVVFNET